MVRTHPWPVRRRICRLRPPVCTLGMPLRRGGPILQTAVRHAAAAAAAGTAPRRGQHHGGGERLPTGELCAEYHVRFGKPAAEPGTAFVAYTGQPLADVPCVQADRQVGRDTCMLWARRSLQIHRGCTPLRQSHGSGSRMPGRTAGNPRRYHPLLGEDIFTRHRHLHFLRVSVIGIADDKSGLLLSTASAAL